VKIHLCIENIAIALEFFKKNLFEGLVFRLGAMVRDGHLDKDRSYYNLPEKAPIYITSKLTADRDTLLELFSHNLNKKVG
ncbi:ribonuclease R, partial [Francisella tularensis subsp. holarctica]|nr:ribonuclease R [Francisella tularensis subsp. holarctica]